jgi:glucose/arabinose dehydrogenase
MPKRNTGTWIMGLSLRLSLIILIPLHFGYSQVWASEAQKNGGNSSGFAYADNKDDLILPGGFRSIVVTDRLEARPARHIAVRDNGDIFIKMNSGKSGKGIAALRDSNKDGKAELVNYFGSYDGTGIAIYNGYLYASSDAEIYRYKLTHDGSLLPEIDAELVVSGFPVQTEHAAKGLAFDKRGNLYVSVGGPSNACMIKHRTAGSAGQDPCRQLERQAGIWRFVADKLNQTQLKDGVRYATGLRNPMALDWNMEADSLYAAQHGRDQLSMFWPQLFDDRQNAELPAEELFQVGQADDFGWPYCYYDHLQGRKILAPEYGGDGKKSGRCAGKKAPLLAFPGHLAPNDLLFYTGNQFPEKYQHGAFIAFHGSWNRAPLEQKGYFVVFVPFKGDKGTGDWEIFADNFAGRDFVQSPAEARYRPTGLAQGPDGSLYIADSVRGRVWRIVYTGK